MRRECEKLRRGKGKDKAVAEYVPGNQGNAETKTRHEVKPPQKYRVLMHNDDYTTQDFVVAILMAVFYKPIADATRIMLQIHKNGIGMCGVYTAEVAETKVTVVHQHAQEHGFPLRCTMEPE